LDDGYWARESCEPSCEPSFARRPGIHLRCCARLQRVKRSVGRVSVLATHELRQASPWASRKNLVMAASPSWAIPQTAPSGYWDWVAGNLGHPGGVRPFRAAAEVFCLRSPPSKTRRTVLGTSRQENGGKGEILSTQSQSITHPRLKTLCVLTRSVLIRVSC